MWESKLQNHCAVCFDFSIHTHLDWISMHRSRTEILSSECDGSRSPLGGRIAVIFIFFFVFRAFSNCLEVYELHNLRKKYTSFNFQKENIKEVLRYHKPHIWEQCILCEWFTSGKGTLLNFARALQFNLACVYSGRAVRRPDSSSGWPLGDSGFRAPSSSA